MFSTEDYFPFFESILFESFGKEIEVNSYQFLGGGCINNAVKLETASGNYCLKWNENPQAEEMFEVEAKGLMILAESSTFTIPYPYKYGRCQGKAYLLLEFVSAIGKNQTYWADLGEQLADLHKNTYQKFGLIFNNFIGELPQSNELMDSWVSFFIEKRLKVQAGLAYYNGLIGQKLLLSFEKLYKILPDILPEESPSLLHGDLWSGNLLVGNIGEPCLIDPAIYYGHREVEIAFTQLFGGFDKQFYEAYQYVYPLYPNFQERVDIYNIYPLLVHTNLFGTSYLSSVEKTLKKFV